MHKISDANIEKFFWNKRFVAQAVDPSYYAFNKRLLRKLNKRDVLDGLTKIYNFEDKKILDIGTGNGEFILSLAKRHSVKKIIAVDFSEEGTKLAEKKRKILGLSNCTFIVADANYLPFKNKCFDVVTMIGVLHHMAAPQKILREVYRLSKTFILIEKNRLNPYEWYTTSKKKERYPSDPSFFIWKLIHLIKSSGFDMQQINYYQLVTYSIYNLRILKFFFWRDAFIKKIFQISHFLQKIPGVRCFSHIVMVKGERKG